MDSALLLKYSLTTLHSMSLFVIPSAVVAVLARTRGEGANGRHQLSMDSN